MGLTASVLVPLYIYPNASASAWDPLYNAANTSSVLNFTVIVNPSSVPGGGAVPDDNYMFGIEKLNAFANVRTLGYVPLTYANRTLNDTLNDINVYAGRQQHSTALVVDGIFFDEAPREYSDQSAAYIQQLRGAVQAADGIKKEKLVIYNPGTMPAGASMYSSSDVVVGFEDTYNTFQDTDFGQAASNRTQYSCIVHTVPSTANFADLVDSVSQNAGCLFVTNIAAHDMANPYGTFSSIWTTFVNDMPSA